MTDPVAAYTADLAGALRGPRRAKERLVAEIGDGLREAAAAYRGAGVDAGTALERALDDVGRPHEVAPSCQAELTVRQARATASVLVLAVAAVLVGWHLMWVGAELRGWSLAAVVVAVVPALGALLASATLLVTGRFGRAIPEPAWLVTGTAWAATATSVAMLVVTAALLAGQGVSAPVVACTVLTVGLHAAVASSARACRRCSALDRAAGSRG